VVRHYGGTVDEFTGDGLIAVFGAPVALEDHALCACHAAVFIHEEADRLSGEGRERDGVDCGCGSESTPDRSSWVKSVQVH
jgi:class 3 adenylate cyclase